MCSSAMSWGMTYERFWHCKWSEFFAYMRKHQIEEEREAEWQDVITWQQGQYILEALLSVYPLFNSMIDAKKLKEKHEYPKKPYSQVAKAKKKMEAEGRSVESIAERIRKHNAEIAALGK